MARRKQSKGSCEFCGKEMTRGGLTKHFKSCTKRKASIEGGSGAAHDNVYHLIVSDPYWPDMWLHLELGDSWSLEDLDDYLRTIWLECCGHLSRFEIDGLSYEPSTSVEVSKGWYEVESMDINIGQVLEVGQKINYAYDFGSTTHLQITVADVRQGKTITHLPVFLMARNQIPKFECQECKEQADFICHACMYDEEKSGLLCKKHKHKRNHQHVYDYGDLLTVVNSPRMGECGYSGPADPPY